MNGWANRFLILLALVAAVAGTAFAANELSGSATKKPVRACVTKKTGQVRVLLKKRAKCRRPREVALTWARRGPRGAAGTQGASGAPGPTGAGGVNGADGTNGEPGPSNAYIKTDPGTSRAVGSSDTRLVTLRGLPAGSYLVHADVPLAPFETGTGPATPVFVVCHVDRLSDDAQIATNQTTFYFKQGGRADQPPISMTGPVTLSAPGDIGLECRTLTGGADLESSVGVTRAATRVGSLDVQPYSGVNP